jgi:hypothetical protein
MSLEKKPSGLFQSAPDFSHRATLERLCKQHSVPKLGLHPTIGGEIEFLVHRELREEREGRIEDMKKRLAEMRGHVENVFALAQLKTHASRDFERSR